jgi:hypothetical protein
MYSGTGASITVSINKKAAEQDLKELEKTAEGTAGRIGDKGGGKGGIGGGLVGGLSRAMGRGYSLGRRAAHRLGAFSVLNDITSEGLTGLSAAVDLGLGGAEVRAKRQVRDDTLASHTDMLAAASTKAEKTAARGAAVEHYNTHLPGALDRETAKGEIVSLTAGWGDQGATLKGPLDRMTDAITTAISQGFAAVNGTLSTKSGGGR